MSRCTPTWNWTHNFCPCSTYLSPITYNLVWTVLQLFIHKESHIKSMCGTLGTSKTVVELTHCPLGKSHHPSVLHGGRVLIGLEFSVIVWELIEKDGYGETVEDDSKRDADERKETAQYRLWVNVSVAHRGDADLQRGKESSQLWWRNTSSFILCLV